MGSIAALKGRGGRPFPSFRRPPVVEVALAVGFEPLPGLTAAELGVLWQTHYRGAGLTEVEEQPPVQMPIEQFDEVRPATLKIEMVVTPPPPRLWFRNKAGTELVQVQHNWFARNWRKMETEDEYPHYEVVRGFFDDSLKRFFQFVKDEGLGEILPNQCEVTYLNHILVGDGWDGFGAENQVLSVLSGQPDAPYLSRPELARASVQYVIPGEGNEAVGRLYVVAEPAFRAHDRKPMLVLTLTARGQSQKEGLEGISDFLDLGHEWVVFGFVDVTTERMHETWGLEHGDD
jgi:uncharacterized protein (TIGR04255 family)